MSPADPERFNSWKEIATHLGVDVRTARRWEQQRALPVHSPPGGGRRTVYGYRDEIDKWLRNAGEEQLASTEQVNAVIPGPEPSAKGPATVEDSITAEVELPDPNRARHHSQDAKSGRAYLRFWLLAPVSVVVILAGASLIVRAFRPPDTLLGHHGATADDKLAAPMYEPMITSVSGIRPQPDQTIVIKGRYLGTHVPYVNQDTPYIAIRDLTGKWAAGRIIPRNWDEVTLGVSKWNDSEIIVTGFSGAYGQGDWKLRSGDDVDIAVWNPQTGAGPAIFKVVCGQQ